MKRLLLVSALSLALPFAAGCSSEASPDSDDEASAVERGDTKVEAYAFNPEGDDSEAPFLVRLTIKRSEVTGYVLTKKAEQSQAMPRMPMRGRVEADGTYKLQWALSFKGIQEVPVAVKRQGDALVGTMGEGNDQKNVSFKPIKPSPTPTIGIYGDRIERGQGSGCQLDVGGFEVFGLTKATVESDLNARLKKIGDRPKELCAGTIDYISGGAFLGVVTNEVLSYSARYTMSGANDEYKVDGTTRENIYLDTGKAVALYGDVLQNGKEAELLAEIEKAIDAAPARDVPDDKKAELKNIMQSQKSAGKLAKEFLLQPRGISFAAPGYSDPRIAAVFVKWSALTPLLAQNGKAHTVWEQAPATP